MKKKVKYNANSEWQKDFKFNGHWYHLKSLFDQDQDLPYDFNAELDAIVKTPFDFNDAIYDDLDDVFSIDTPELSSDYDFNEALNEGTENQSMFETEFVNAQTDAFKNFYKSVNECANETIAFDARLNINIVDSDNKTLCTIDFAKDDTQENEANSKAITTILKGGGGYANEAIIRMLKGNNEKATGFAGVVQNKLFTVINEGNAYAFPDAMFDNIPIDLKVRYNGKQNSASGSNTGYMTGIFSAIIKAYSQKKSTSSSEKQGRPSLFNYITTSPCGSYKNHNFLQFDNNKCMPELKGFLLCSKTIVENNKLIFNGFCIHSIIDCLHGGVLFDSKRKGGQGDVHYYEVQKSKTINDNSILNGMPTRFVEVIRNFYNQENISDIKKYISNFDLAKSYLKLESDQQLIDLIRSLITENSNITKMEDLN